MPVVFPSQVIEFIEAEFPNEIGPLPPGSDGAYYGPDTAPQLKALISLIERIPSTLITLEGLELGEFYMAQSAVSATADHCETTRSGVQLPRLPRARLPIAVIWELLGRCPDAVPASALQGLNFITPAEYRELLLRDIGAVETALHHSEWKAATVLAGSTIEALLLWGIQQQGAAAITAMVAQLVQAGMKQPNKQGVEHWNLTDFVKVARGFGLIGENTEKLGMLAAEYRNLIHPGKAQRESASCNRSTARTAAAALDAVVEELAARQR